MTAGWQPTADRISERAVSVLTRAVAGALACNGAGGKSDRPVRPAGIGPVMAWASPPGHWEQRPVSTGPCATHQRWCAAGDLWFWSDGPPSGRGGVDPL